MNLQWYPGHMAKTKRIMMEKLRICDIVAELLDARAIYSSKNPDIDTICGEKPRIVVFNKSDMADVDETRRWVKWYRARGIGAVSVCSRTGVGVADFRREVSLALTEKRKRDEARGMVGRSVKMMVVGIPNVGKSAFINRLSGRGAAAVGDRPGVTRAEQWVRIEGGYELLDTPGVLWPRFDDENVALNLAFTGAIKDEIIDTVELAARLCFVLREKYSKRLMERYKLEDIGGIEGYEILEMIGRKRGFLAGGGEIDVLRAANILLDEFRGGKLGAITLESAPEGE